MNQKHAPIVSNDGVARADYFLATTVNQPSAFSIDVQKPEKADLFVNIDKSKADLTPQQQESLAQLAKQTTTMETRLVRVKTQLLTPSPSKLLTINLGKEFDVARIETRPKDEALTWIGKPLAR